MRLKCPRCPRRFRDLETTREHVDDTHREAT
jgi:uncharacterized C2H2 Zn-finger protein